MLQGAEFVKNSEDKTVNAKGGLIDQFKNSSGVIKKTKPYTNFLDRNTKQRSQSWLESVLTLLKQEQTLSKTQREKNIVYKVEA